jgi:peptidoglycan/LPS O-acetylase OafA/YrhL
MLDLLCVSKPILFFIVIILIIQYILSVYCIFNVLKNKPKKLNKLIWQIIILLLIFLGPILYLLIEKPFNSVKKDVNGIDKI